MHNLGQASIGGTKHYELHLGEQRKWKRENTEIQIRPRSGLASKNNISVLNTPGTIDSDYRGELKIILFNHGENEFIVNNQDRVAQMVLAPIIKATFEEVEELPETIRGEGGFGSTGKWIH